ncbi:MAG: PTS mannose transporter subunit IIA [Neisseria sp.]|nr:PTS mannose transporter subunit IIA [Neisseria sp.]
MIGLLVITHEAVGQAYRALSEHFFNQLPDYVRVMGIHRDEAPEDILARAQILIDELPADNGVLVLTDIFGATPCNIARKLLTKQRIAMLTGLNAPMMIKALQYAQERTDIEAFAHEVQQAAIDGIIRVDEECEHGCA